MPRGNKKITQNNVNKANEINHPVRALIREIKRSEWRLALTYLFFFFLLLGNAALANRSVQALRVSQISVTQSCKERLYLKDLSLEFEKSLSAGRALVITNDLHFMEAFDESQRAIKEHVNRIEATAQDNIRQQRNSQKLRASIEEQMAFAKHNFDTSYRQGKQLTVTPALMEQSKKRIATITQLIHLMEQEEEGLEKERAEQSLKDEVRTRFTIFSATVGAILALVVAFVLTQRILKERRVYEESLIANQNQILANQTQIVDLNHRLQRAILESHHRIKNNLQVLVALVETMRFSDPPITLSAALERLGGHIRGLAVMHDILTHQTRTPGESLEMVSAKTALERLLPAFGHITGNQKVTLDADDVTLSLKQVSALSQLTNELLSNAIKHGTGAIHLSLKKEDNNLVLETHNEGPPFPPDFNPSTSNSTGISLIESIGSWDLGGKISYENTPTGPCVRIVFPPVSPDSSDYVE